MPREIPDREGEPVRRDYQPPATWSSDWQVLKSMIFADVKGETQQERLEAFYISQASLYDSYRHRMLHGRLPMAKAMPAPKGGTWVDMGGGTGSNLEFFGSNLNHWGKCVVLDLSPSLAEVAQKRINERGWSNFCSVVVGDACALDLPGMPAAGTVDVVTFSYALTMIPDWRAAIRNAFRMLKPGGHIAVCDFTVTKEQWMGMSALWTWIFSNDHVHLKAEHIPTLQVAFETVVCETGFGTFPYVPPVMQCPYYYYVGKKVAKECPI